MKHFAPAALAALFATSAAMPAVADEVTMPLVEDIAPSTGFEGRGHDVLGINFGDSLADTLARLAEQFPGTTPQQVEAEAGVGDGRGNNVTFRYTDYLQLSIDGPPRENITVRFTTPATGNRVYQIVRDISYDRDNLASMAELRASIAEKYGQPTAVELYPHQNTDEITYTFEKRPIHYFPEEDVSKRGFRGSNPINVDVCLMAATDSAHGYDNTYRFQKPGNRQPNPGWDACIGGIKFTIFYGPNAQTVSSVNITATDYDRSMRDGLIADDWLLKALNGAADAQQGKGAPKL